MKSHATKLSENVLDTIDIEDRISSQLKPMGTNHTSSTMTHAVKEKSNIDHETSDLSFKLLEPANFEKEKVFMLQQDSSRSNSLVGTARHYGQGTAD